MANLQALLKANPSPQEWQRAGLGICSQQSQSQGGAHNRLNLEFKEILQPIPGELARAMDQQPPQNDSEQGE